MMKRFFFILCVLFVLVLSISGEISAQEKRDSVRIYFHQQNLKQIYIFPFPRTAADRQKYGGNQRDAVSDE